MQFDEAVRLQHAWEAKGNPPCEHPFTEKEYYLSESTGDNVCTTCGHMEPRRGGLKSS
ncbi:hypothetical protein ACFW2T_14270 [Streptomyces sp. NPDC058892]|uniref:hypothetical protein n=1 Tax=unclassified Streptomyces TaxID=2593676 RepID=UPI0036C26759